MEMAGNVKLIPSLRKSLRARAMDRCLPTLETSKNLTVNQEVGGSNPPAPVQKIKRFKTCCMTKALATRRGLCH